MKLTSTIQTEGVLKAFKVFPDGKKEMFYEDENLIVGSGKQSIITSLYTQNVMSDPIFNLKVGVGGCIDSAGQYPKTETLSRTTLYSYLLTVGITNTPDLANYQVTFLATIPQTSGNGSKISEAGLFRQSGALFSIKNHPAVTKTADFSIQYEWTIKCL